MRTTPEECRAIGAWIAATAQRLRRARSASSSPSAASPPSTSPGGAFHDPEADAALFDALEAGIDARPPTAASIRLPLHINDPEFADALVAAYREIAEG